MIRVLKSRATSFVVGSIATIFILPTAIFSLADDNEADVEEVVVTATDGLVSTLTAGAAFAKTLAKRESGDNPSCRNSNLNHRQKV